jgi:acetyltransferase-like isoleucine patch superfamily enzyme
MKENKRNDSLLRFVELIESLQHEKIKKYNRRVSLGDLLTDRAANAGMYGFGEGTTCYDNVLILGDVRVGSNSWIGPNVILDGTGGLVIGDNVSISAGAQIYSHSSVARSASQGKEKIETKPTAIGNGAYIGPNAVVQMGVTIGDSVVVGALCFVNRDIPHNKKAYGVPMEIFD